MQRTYFSQDVKDLLTHNQMVIQLKEGEFWACLTLAFAMGFAAAVGFITYLE